MLLPVKIQHNRFRHGGECRKVVEVDNIPNEYRIIDGDSPEMVARETATLMILMIQWAAQGSLLTKSSASA